MTKNQIRTDYRARRHAIPSHEKMRLDDLLLIQFQSFDFSQINTVLSYWPIESQQEPNVELMARWLRLLYPAIQIAYPKTTVSNNSMQAILADEETDFRTNKWGITEPLEGRVLPNETIDLVLVPLLAFDQQGFRVGYGKGYYDRYLSDCSSNCVKIGFSYFEALDQIADTDQFDVPLNYCITPQHIYEF